MMIGMFFPFLLLAPLLAGSASPEASSIRIEAGDGLPALVPLVRTRDAVQLSPALRGLTGSTQGASIWFLADLREQLDFERSARLLAQASLSRAAQRAWVTRALRAIALRGRRRLRSVLDELKRKGEVDSWTGVSIVNRLLIKGRPAAVEVLSRHPEVASLAGEIESEGSLQTDRETPAAPAEESYSWPLAAIGAKEAWLAGIDGRGVTVGLIDSGASNLHEQLRGNFRGGRRSWFDPLRQRPAPSDVQLGHGTAVLSCAVGRGHPSAPCGVAPGAKWIAAVELNQGRYNNVLATQAADWMLNVGRPDVLIVPWRLLGQPCDDSLRPIVNAWRAAGIVVVFAAGNSGPGPASDVAPANYTRLFPGSATALSVGAVDREGKTDAHSSRGPNRCGEDLFPQLVAPGSDVPVALPAATDLYRRVSGTSFAAAYVAGASALLLQRFPEARVDRIEEALRRGAVDLGPPGPDTAFGYGLINVPRALEYLEGHR